MATVEEFENAPVGAIARRPDGRRATKTARVTYPWDTPEVSRSKSSFLVSAGYTLDPAPPATAREALDLAWELAHPVREGQVIPGRERTIGRYEDGDFFLGMSLTDRLVTGSEQSYLRTLDPLPDPEPDWLDAPAVLASCRYSDVTREGVFTPSRVHEGRWVLAGTVEAMHWSDLRDVTPLYPKEGKES